LTALEGEAASFPGANPIARLSYEITQQLQDESLGLGDIQNLIQHLTGRAFQFRANRMVRYLGQVDEGATHQRLVASIETLASRCESFESFQAAVERDAMGIVITAHPTFGIPVELADILADLTERSDGGSKQGHPDGDVDWKLVDSSIHGHPAGVDLTVEQTRAAGALTRIGDALRVVHGVVLDVAADHWPERWHELKPALVSSASWVGYDLDGRADIRWTDTFKARMKVKAQKLDIFLERVRSIIAELSSSGALTGQSALAPTLKLLESRLQFASRVLADDLADLPEDPSMEDHVARFSRRMTSGDDGRLTETGEIIALLDQAVGHAEDMNSRRALGVLRAELVHEGLALAQTHVRLNASQIRNAVRKQLGIDSAPDAPGLRHKYLKEVTELLGSVEPTTVNFGSILSEPTSARRMCMLIAQMLKYIDRSQPIRFLIAETETPFTVLAALYLARLFGIDQDLDISPLFETADALEHGHGIIEDLLENSHYRDYVVMRGCLCIQTGFSDSGRYIGQIAASLAIERLKMKVAQALAAAAQTDPRLTTVTLLVFDTHGESVGRGAHPIDFSHRLDHVSPPVCRQRFAELGLQVKEEVSFQGGDGYLFFQTPTLALATISRLVEHGYAAVAEDSTAEEGASKADPFYVDTDFSLEFFLAAKRYNEELVDDPDYAALLNAFGVNLFYPAGSRRNKRQHEGPGGEAPHPSQIRAIPNNAILQQMGFLSNSVAGLGRALVVDPERFVEMYRSSPRCRGLVRLGHYAMGLGSADALLAYVSIFDPLVWIQRARFEADPKRREDMRRLGRLLTESGRHQRLARISRALLADRLDLEAGLSSLCADSPKALELDEMRPDLKLLHALRIALIQRIFMLVLQVPRFSSQPDVTIDDVIADLLQLDIPSAVAVLQRAFPLATARLDDEIFGEPATYRIEDAQGYVQEHEQIFNPLMQHHDLVRRVSAAISHVAGAVG